MKNKKTEIIEVACNQLQMSGIAGFSFRDLAEIVGVKSSSVHYYFNNKNDLLLEILINFREGVINQLTIIEKNSTSLNEVLNGVINIFESAWKEDKFCVCGILAAEKKHLTQEVLDELNATFNSLSQWLQGVINHYGGVKIPTESFALLLISAVEGSLLIDRLDHKQKYFSALRETVQYLC